jgi:hypothetical protein
MRTLRRGSVGPDVKRWQFFLIGQGFHPGEADSDFGGGTETETTALQKKLFGPNEKRDPPGVVGDLTIAKVIPLGFRVLIDDDDAEHGPNWPPKPGFLPLTGNAARQSVFGKFQFQPKPIPGNPENIVILGDWVQKNIVLVNIPQLIGVKGFPKSGNVQFHKLGAKQLAKLFADWKKAGLISLVQTWGGTFVPRFVRGSTKTLSNHSQGSAFDCNMEWNALGAVPALAGDEGSTRELVPIANENGFYWGGHFSRQDGMHFELGEVRP